MNKYFKTLTNDINIFFKEYFIIPFLIAIAITLIWEIIIYITHKNKNKFQYIYVFFITFYYAELFYITLLSRIGTNTNSLSDIFGEWSIFDGETSMYLNLRPTLNIILFLPFCVITYFIAKNILNKAISHKKLFILTSLFSFSTSIIIELIQLVFCLGTFQISDLVYNTLGGVMGAIIFVAVRKLYRHIKKARTQ